MTPNLQFLLLLFGLWLSSSIQAANVCKKPNSIKKPSNGQPYYWPAAWDENHAAPAVGNFKTCTWTVSVPDGYYARLIMSGEAYDLNTTFQTIDSAGNVIQTTHESMDPYFFPSQKFTISIASNDEQTRFAFKIQWAQLPEIGLIRGVGAVARVINVTQNVYAADYSADKVSLIAFPQDPTNIFPLRSTLVYQSDSTDDGYVSSLYTIYRNNSGQWISKGEIVLVNLEASGNMDKLLIQDGSRTRDIVQYKKLIPSQNGTSLISVDGGNQKSAIVYIGNHSITLTNVDIDDASIVSVYNGTPDPFTLDKMYTGVTLKKALPLRYPGGGVWQFVVKSGKATFTFQN